MTPRWLAVASTTITVAGGLLTGYQLATAFFEGDRGADGRALAYVEADPCPGCPVSLDSAQVQARDGSTLFVFGGAWPRTVTALPSDLRLEANDTAITLHPTQRGVEVVDATGLDPRAVAVGLKGGSLLLNVAEGLPSGPLLFEFGLWDGQGFSARIPREGSLSWDGSGRPVPIAGETGPQPATQTPHSFLASLATAIQESDDAFLLQKLHPEVLDRYGEENCTAHVAAIHDPTRSYALRSASGPEPWAYDSDGQSVTIRDALTLDVAGIVDGEKVRLQLHVAPGADGDPAWFTDCGAPLP